MTPEPAWRQVHFNFDSPDDAEQWATDHALSLLNSADDDGIIDAWWFVRKHPQWRFRLRTCDADRLTSTLAASLADHSAVRACTAGIYEPEITRFGGTAAMAVAHDLFTIDSRYIVEYLAAAGNHRHELAVRLVTRMATTAGLDLYEQGDLWRRVADHRATDTTPTPAPATLTAIQTLITATSDAPESPLERVPAWASAFERTGNLLSSLAHRGELTRGLRAILADHTLFTFNRLGISASEQALLATAAHTFIFHRTHTTTAPRTDRMTTMPSAPPTHTDPVRLREDLVAKIDSLGTFRTPAVREAFLTVPRHVFLPDVDVAQAYVPRQVVTKRAADGSAISSASSPNIVAAMLEQLAPQRGQNILEIGAATGINAALLAELAGDSGHVTSIELDQDLADGARRHLAEAGYQRVDVICGDGALGAPDQAPYDRIIVTAGAWDIPETWWDQLAVGGRLVVPLGLHGSGLTRSLAFERTTPDTMVSTDAVTCGFVPMRGDIERGQAHIRLADDVVLKVENTDTDLAEILTAAFEVPDPLQIWSGIHVRHDEPVANLDLWLATHCATHSLAFGKLSVSDTARRLGLADPARRWSGATLYTDDGTTMAHLITRTIDENTEEIGLTIHGHSHTIDSAQTLLHAWNETRPAHPTITARRPGNSDMPAGRRSPIIDHRATSITISW